MMYNTRTVMPAKLHAEASHLVGISNLKKEEATMTVRDMMSLLVVRGVVFVPPKATVWESDFILKWKMVGTVLVMDGDGEVFPGIVSEQDFAYFILAEKLAKTTPITEIMIPAERVTFATPEISKVVGLVSIRDLAFDFANIQDRKLLEREGYLLTVS